MSIELTIPKVGSRWRLRMWLDGTYDYAKNSYRADGKYAPNRTTNNVIEIVSAVRYHDSKDEEQNCFVYVVRKAAGRDRHRKYRVNEIGFISAETLNHCWREEVSE
jgi:hypothetical protein